jgi:hypothetical protein
MPFENGKMVVFSEEEILTIEDFLDMAAQEDIIVASIYQKLQEYLAEINKEGDK